MLATHLRKRERERLSAKVTRNFAKATYKNTTHITAMSKTSLPTPYTTAAPPPPATPSWTPAVPTWPQATPDLSSSDSLYESSSSSSSSTFGIVIGVLVGVLGLFLLFVIWRKYLRKKLDSSKC